MRNTEEVLFREFVIGNIDNVAENEESRSISLSFSSEEPVVRMGENEILRHNDSSVDLGRLNSIGTLLFNHNADKPIGKIESAKIENGRGEAVVSFDTDEESDVIFQKVKRGSLRGVSVGYRVNEWSHDKAGKIWYAERWTPLEISIVSVPADPSVGVNRKLNYNENNERNEIMPELDTVNVERQRCAELQNLGSKYGIESEVVSDWITKGAEIATAKDFILERMAEKNRPSAPVVSNDISITRAEEDSFVERAAEVLTNKMTDEKGRYEGMENMSLHSACRRLLNFKGRSYKDIERLDNFELVRAAMDTTGLLTSLTDNVANKSLSSWQEAGVTYPYITTSNTVKDFRVSREYTLSAFGTIEPVKEGENVQYKTFSDEFKEFGVDLYRVGFMMTEQMLINDDISMLSQYSKKVTDGVYRTLNQKVYDCLFSNGRIYDNKALFHADHRNSAATASAISIKSLAEGIDGMAKQKDFSGQAVLNITPRILLCDTSLGVFAGQLIDSAVDPNKHNAVPNPMHQKFTIVTDPIISTYSATSAQNWFLMAMPSIEPVIRISYLQKYQRPTITSYTDLENLCIKYQVSFGFGVNVVGFKGIYKNAGVPLANY